MTKMTYDVINRPKLNQKGRTNIGWGAECGREEVAFGGFLITSRTLPDAKKNYIAFALIPVKDKKPCGVNVGTNFETRASAAFAIHREYYKEARDAKNEAKSNVDDEREVKRKKREEVRALRTTPEGARAYREELNEKARDKRANMTDADRTTERVKRLVKRENMS